jgi:hypothetical protein
MYANKRYPFSKEVFGHGGQINGSSCSHVVDNVVKALI